MQVYLVPAHRALYVKARMPFRPSACRWLTLSKLPGFLGSGLESLVTGVPVPMPKLGLLEKVPTEVLQKQK